MIQTVITVFVIIFWIAGAVDYLLGGKLGLYPEFERGLSSFAKLLLCMGGFLALVPLLADILAPAVSPFFRAIGADPSLFAGFILANDSGGAALAMQMADDPAMGLYNGYIVGAIIGCTIMFSISFTIANMGERERTPAIYGLLVGIITSPVGCLAGGFAAGFDKTSVLRNTLPVLVLAAVLALLLVFARQAIVIILNVLGKVLLAISVFGITLAGAQTLSGVTLVEGLSDLGEIFSIICNICIFLAGMFPFLAVLRKVLRKPIAAFGRRLGITEMAANGLLVDLANAIPTITSFKDMDEKGILLNVAFIVSASAVFGDHLAYTSQVAPEMVASMIVGKLAGGLCALALGCVLAPKLLKQKK